MDDELKPCPCGKIPERLSIQDGSTYRWRYVGCPCDEWWIEASVRPADRNDADEIYRMCADAWNAAPRVDLARLPDGLAERLRKRVAVLAGYEAIGLVRKPDTVLLNDILRWHEQQGGWG